MPRRSILLIGQNPLSRDFLAANHINHGNADAGGNCQQPAVAIEVLESLGCHRLLCARQIRALHMSAANPSWTHP